ncbi:MAG: hypothetical protein LC793_22035 [Thermomicrobia bacterium]|nr:hypothetical protein [Thermomicrobia bacterium]
MALMDASDDLPPTRQRRAPSGLTDIKKYREIQNDNLAKTDREANSAKILQVHPHHDLIRRTDTWWAIKALGRTKRDFTRADGTVGKEWWVFLGCEFGWVTDDRGILRPHKGKQEPIERDLTFEEVADHYGLNRSTVEEYDRVARRTYRKHVVEIRAEGPGPDDWE